MKYDYSIVRYVPDSFRGEFVNVAVLAGSEEAGEWGLRQVSNPQRARRLEGGVGLQAAWAYLDSVAALFETSEEEQGAGVADVPNGDWLNQEYRRLRNTVQLSTPSAIVAEDLNTALAQLHELFIVDPERVTRRTRTHAIATLRSAFQATIPSENLFERVTATVGRQRAHVDFAVANGSLSQLAHAWTFEVADPDKTVEHVKAWLLTIRDLRDKGGTMGVKGTDEQYLVPTGVDVEVVYVPPVSASSDALDIALEVFESSEVRAVPAARADEVAKSALESLEHS